MKTKSIACFESLSDLKEYFKQNHIGFKLVSSEDKARKLVSLCNELTVFFYEASPEYCEETDIKWTSYNLYKVFIN